MAARISEPAIVLHAYDYSESSQVLSLLCRQTGRLRLLAKGTRRSTRTCFSPGIDLLELGHAVARPAREHGQLGVLIEWSQQDAFLHIRRSRLRLLSGLYAAELSERMTEEADPHPELFDDLAGLLRTLERGVDEPGHEPPEVALTRFIARLLRHVGYAPQWTRCVACGKPYPSGARTYFSSTAGGVLCTRCSTRYADRVPVPPGVLSKQAGPAECLARFELLDAHITRLAGRPLRSRVLLHPLLAARTRGGVQGAGRGAKGAGQRAQGHGGQPPSAGSAQRNRHQLDAPECDNDP